MQNTKHVAIYVRVSSRNQDTASQKPDLERWAAEQKETDQVVQRQIHRQDDGSSRLAQAGSRHPARQCIYRIVVWRLDRLGRTAKGLTALFQELQDRKVGLVSIREGLDLSTPAGRLMAHVLASVAQYETEVRGERILAGQAAARAAGKHWGGSKAGRRVKVTPEQAESHPEYAKRR